MSKHPSPQDLLNLSLEKEMSSKTPKTPFPILAIDYGERFCGLAYSPDGILAIPLAVVETVALDTMLEEVLLNKKIEQAVVGLPLTDSREETSITQTIKDFGDKLSQDVPVSFIDERGSSKSVLQSQSKKNQREDDLAAQNILEYFLSQK